MKLLNAQLAPDFQRDDISERKIHLHDNEGKKTLLAFFRNVTCPFCNVHVLELKKYHEKNGDKLRILMVFESEKRVLTRSTFHASVSPVPIISDPEQELYTLYGLERSIIKMGLGIFDPRFKAHKSLAKELGLDTFKDDSPNINKDRMPAEFLLLPDNTIYLAHYASNVTDRLTIETIDAFTHLAV